MTSEELLQAFKELNNSKSHGRNSINTGLLNYDEILLHLWLLHFLKCAGRNTKRLKNGQKPK